MIRFLCLLVLAVVCIFAVVNDAKACPPVFSGSVGCSSFSGSYGVSVLGVHPSFYATPQFFVRSPVFVNAHPRVFVNANVNVGANVFQRTVRGPFGGIRQVTRIR